MSRAVLAIPAGIFLALALLLAAPFVLELNPRVLPTALLDKPAPQFDLPPIEGLTETIGLNTADLVGRPGIVNIFASWCLPCLAEHPLITRLADEGYAVYGIDYRDAEFILNSLVEAIFGGTTQDQHFGTIFFDRLTPGSQQALAGKIMIDLKIVHAQS